MGNRKRQKAPRVIYIACEGTNTEYWYFKSLGESLEEEDNVQLKIYPDSTDWKEIRRLGEKGAKTDHKSLCTKVAERLNNNEGIDEGWIVIDKDGHLRLEETFKEAEQSGVHVAFSSISFEHWLLLHFEKNDNAFQKSDCKNKENDKYVQCGSQQPKYPDLDCHGNRCVASILRLKNYITDFDKSDKNIFAKTQPRHPIAYENAAWLRWRKRNDLNNFKGKIFQINPYSNLDELIKSIFEVEEEIIWGYYGDSIHIRDLRLIIQQVENGFFTTIFNTSVKTQVILPTQFFLSDAQSQRLQDKFIFNDNKANILIESGKSNQFFISPGKALYGTNYFNFKFGNQRVIFTQ